ncbi:MAG: heavy metal-responsive transcriptional regulator [bacterium]|nr:heavy metal-responsive transcriptional regulator [bacterium]
MRIGALSRKTGIPRSTVRYYERLGLVDPPPRTAGGYRRYGPEHEARLTFVRQAKLLGLSLDDIASLIRLRTQGLPPCARLRELVRERLAEVDDRIRELVARREAMARHYEGLPAAEQAPPGTVCGLVEAVAGATHPDGQEHSPPPPSIPAPR